jgi:hypothetical protein
MTGDIVLFLRGGTYSVGSTLAFGPPDGGHDNHSVIWQAYPGEKPVLSGGTRITGWTSSDGVTYSAAVPSTLATRQLWVNDVRAVRARGAYNPSGFALIPTGCGPTTPCTGYSNTNTAMHTWGNQQDIEVFGINEWKTFRCPVNSIASNGTVLLQEPCWSCAHADENSNGVPGDAGDYPIGLPTWIENARELLDERGEWYLDRTVSGGLRHLYYMPRYGEDFSGGLSGSTTTVIAGTLDGPIVRISGANPTTPVDHLSFRGLTFAYDTWLGPSNSQGFDNIINDYYITTPDTACYTPPHPQQQPARAEAAVEVSHATHLEFSDNTFAHLGRTALGLGMGVSQSSVQGNLISDVSGSGILLGHILADPSPADEAWGMQIKNNYVTRVGVDYFGSVGIWLGYTRDNAVEHNEILSTPYSGLSLGWIVDSDAYARNEVSDNLIHHAMGFLNDGGLVYTRSDQHDSSLNGNFLHSQNNAIPGLYLDNGTAALTVGGAAIDGPGNVVLGAPLWRALNQTPIPAISNTVTNNWTDRDDLTTVEAENYDRFSDQTTGNAGGAYRSDNVDIYSCAGCSNGYTVGFTQNGEWLEFDQDLFIWADLDVQINVASVNSGGSVKMCVYDPALVSPPAACGSGSTVLAVPVTGNYNTYQTVKGTLVVPFTSPPHAPRGRRVFRLEFIGGFNIDDFRYKPQHLCCGSTPSEPANPNLNVVDPNTVVTGCVWPADAMTVMRSAGLETSYRYLGGPAMRIEGEDFNVGGEGVKPWTSAIDCHAGYHDLTPNNVGLAYRQEYDVDVYAQPAASNGYTLGGIQTGEWVRYNLSMRYDASYAFDFAVATVGTGNSITLELDDNTSSQVTVGLPNTGGFDHYQTATINWPSSLAAGFHRARLIFTGPGFGLDYFEVRKLP